MLPYINTRSSQLNQEFAFFPSAPPHIQGGIFELRSYQLMPGTLLQWENTWWVDFLLVPESKYHGHESEHVILPTGVAGLKPGASLSRQ